MYFGVIGPIDTNGFAQYIYGHQYELRKLTAIHSQLAAGSDAVFEINPAFGAALDIDLLYPPRAVVRSR